VISFIIPTHDRPERLRRTIDALGALPARAGAAADAEVIVIDNASSAPVRLDAALPNGWDVTLIRLDANEAAAGRNLGAAAARHPWLVMLDDDSHPLDLDVLDVLCACPDDVAAVGADIRLPDGRREAGGLPEVFIGCGVAIRREAFLAADGYDPAFHYYAEEYDLAARLLLRGWRIEHDARFRVLHEKEAVGRDMDRIAQRLVRNNGWVAQRYAPAARLDQHVREVIARYARMAVRESASLGYVRGLIELFSTRESQQRTPMSDALFDRFIGSSHVRSTVQADPRLRRARTAYLVEPGKGEPVIRSALREHGVEVIDDAFSADVLVIGTLSPGPMLDAWERAAARGHDAVLPWRTGIPAHGRERGQAARVYRRPAPR
jgi:GT2 family glycosyltransferase